MAAGMTRAVILRQLKELSEQHHFSYSHTTVKYTLAVTVDDRTLTLLNLIWQAKNSWQRYRID